MCGISGIFNFNGISDVQLPHVVRMTKAMQHRGPDDEGFVAFGNDEVLTEFFGHDTPINVRESHPQLVSNLNFRGFYSKVALGHRRLSIVDISPGGHQPMPDLTRRYWIVFNGEIYNYKDLRKELASAGYQFRTESDTEVILAAYSRWKENCLVRFNGDFAFAIWDRKNHTLFCARDRIGIKPFYYVLDNDRFIFGSDIKALLASGLHIAEPNTQGLYLAMAFGIAPRPITAFKGICALEQANWMRLHLGGRIEKGRYWQIPVGTQIPNMKEAEAVELIEEQLKKAVSYRLVADVPVGTFMSGGVDSTLITAIASKKDPNITAITIGFDSINKEMDEAAEAQAVAKKNNFNHKIVLADPKEELRFVEEMMKGFEEPYYNLSPGYVISRHAAKAGLKVVLAGNGADEIFCGYSWYQTIPRWRAIRTLAAWVPSQLGSKVLSDNRLARLYMLSRIKNAAFLHTNQYKKWNDSTLRNILLSFKSCVNSEDYVHQLYDLHQHFSDDYEAMSFMDLTHYIGSHFVSRLDQMTMAHSVEARFPFLDHEFIEAAYKIPTRLKIIPGTTKYILKRMAAPYLDPKNISMKKKGFGLPLKSWMESDLVDYVGSNMSELLSRVDVGKNSINSEYEKYKIDEKKMNYSKIWHLISLNRWLNNYGN